MAWNALSHGTNGLLMANGLTLVALFATLMRQRAQAGLLLMSPIVAVPCALVGALAAGLVAQLVAHAAIAAPWVLASASAVVLILAGVGSGVSRSKADHRSAALLKNQPPVHALAA